MARSAACSAAALRGLGVTASRTGADAGALPVSVAPWIEVARVAVAPQLEEATEADADGAAAAPSVTSTPSVLAAARPRRATHEWDMGVSRSWYGVPRSWALPAQIVGRGGCKGGCRTALSPGMAKGSGG